MKSEMTSFDIAVLVFELGQSTIGSRIENIYQIDSSTLVFRLHQPNRPTLQLLIQSGKRMHLTSYVLGKPQKPPAFCMALRKHLRSGKIRLIQQHEFDRVITTKIETKEGIFSLVTELFGDGNIILVSPQGTILYALTYRKMRDRDVLRGESFKYAPSSGRNPLSFLRPDFDDIKGYGQLEIVRALTKFLSIGGTYAEEILLRSEIDKTAPCASLSKQQIDTIYNETQKLLSKTMSGQFEPSIVIDGNGEMVDVIPFPLKRYTGSMLKKFKTFNEALDEYYSKSVTTEKISNTEKEFAGELTKLQRTLEDQKKTLDESLSIIENNKSTGSLIYSHLGELQLLAQMIVENKERGKTWEQINKEIEKEKQAGRIPFIYFESLDQKRRILNVTVENKTFSLDLTRSIQASAASYFERAKKTEKKREGAQKALVDTLLRIQELERSLKEQTVKVIEEAPPKRKERAWYEKFHWFRSSDGFLAIGGRDATTNEIIIKKHTEPGDVVFHADIAGAPFVVIKTEGRTPSEQVLREAAQLAASHSRAWREMLHAIDVYWVHPEQISKTPPSGQYLTKGSFIIQGAKNYVKAVPLRLAVGIQQKDDQTQVIGGPSDAIAKQTNMYVEIIPGQETSGKLAKQIRHLLSEKAGKQWQSKTREIPIEQIQQFIPFGKGAIAPKPQR